MTGLIKALSPATVEHILKGKTMRLASEWKRVLRHAWSIRLIALAGMLSGIEAALPLFGGLLPIPPVAFALATLIVVAAAFVARLVAQEKLSDAD
jgi:hypothetical protein